MNTTANAPAQLKVNHAPGHERGDERGLARGLLHWLHIHLFDGWLNTALALACLALLVWLVPPVWRWLVTDSQTAPADFESCKAAGGACWAYLQAKWRLILFGTYTYDEQWRPALAIGLFIGAAALSAWPAMWTDRPRRLGMAGLWLFVLLAVAVLMPGGIFGLATVEHRLWSGLPLTMGLAVIGCLSAFVIAVALALGRRSEMPVIRWICIGYIEFVRGVPLLGLLFLATILFPLLVPPDVDIDKLARAQIAFVMFFAAYMAEAIRGGLQSIPAGQYAAAESLDLGYWRTQWWVVLPQALQRAVPSLVNVFISAFKDTSLVTIVSMMDLLGTANAAKADPKWWGLYIESYLFIAVIYFVFCAAMSRVSRRWERRT